MKAIGVTGNIASGKSTVAAMFRKSGAKVIDADALARRLTQKGTPLYRAIVKIFGPDFLGKDRELDRRKLAWQVFSHPADLKKLNILIHPGVILEVYKVIEKQKKKKGLLVLDVPLLFESRMEKLVDLTVVVKADPQVMLSRAAHNGVPRVLAKKILASQWPLSKKEKLADHIIDNNGTLKELEAQVKKVLEQVKP